MRIFESAVPAVAQMTEGSVLEGNCLLASELRKKLGPDDDPAAGVGGRIDGAFLRR
jgi:hypothetical protein